MRLLLLLAALASTAACATVPASDEPERRMPAGECDAQGSQGHVGETATADLGARLLAETHARVLRWVPPRTAVTMDYRHDRLTVSYADDYTVQRISCG
ncbi:MAG: I78 family peptidase inhibitor [Tsuneonella sp.]